MQIIDLDLSHDNFYCPATGHHIVGPQHYEASPALVGMWHCEVLEEPEIQDAALETSYKEYLKQIEKEEEWPEMDEFLASFESPNFVAFKITTHGIACGPVSSTVWYVINMDYEDEGAADVADSTACEGTVAVTSHLLEGPNFKQSFRNYLGANFDRVVASVQNGEYTDETDLEEAFQESLLNCAETVFTFEWDGDSPLSNGSINIYHVDERYVLLSTDLDGPVLFSSLDEALSIEYFHRPSPKPEISSKVIGLDRMLEIGKDLVDLDGTYWGSACSEAEQSILINGKNYSAVDGRLKIQ